MYKTKFKEASASRIIIATAKKYYSLFLLKQVVIKLNSHNSNDVLYLCLFLSCQLDWMFKS